MNENVPIECYGWTEEVCFWEEEECQEKGDARWNCPDDVKGSPAISRFGNLGDDGETYEYHGGAERPEDCDCIWALMDEGNVDDHEEYLLVVREAWEETGWGGAYCASVESTSQTLETGCR